MGRGNVCTFGEYEGLYYIDWDNYSPEYEDENGEVKTDYDMQREDYEADRDEFVSEFCEKFSSFSPCDEWIDREEHAIAENSLYYLTERDNQWSMAIKLIQKENDWISIEGLQKKHFPTYFEGLKNVLFNFYSELGIYGGAWTSGTIKRSA